MLICFVCLCRFVWKPVGFGETTDLVREELYSPKETKNIPAAGVGSPAGCNTYYPGNCCHHFIGFVLLPPTWRQRRRSVPPQGSASKTCKDLLLSGVCHDLLGSVMLESRSFILFYWVCWTRFICLFCGNLPSFLFLFY